MVRARALSSVVVALMVGGLVGGCGSTSNTPSPAISGPGLSTAGTSSAAATPSGSAAATPSGAAVNPNAIIKVAESAAPSSLDPVLTGHAIDFLAMQNTYQCLLISDQAGNIQPQLASSYTVSSDRLTYDFKLRPNVTFHNSDPFTSADVLYTFDRIKTVSPPNWSSRWFPNTKSITAVGPLEVTFTLATPDPNFPYYMASDAGGACDIQDHNVPATSLTTKMVGTGPYMQTNYIANQELDLAPYPGYWGSKPANGGLKILYIPDAVTQLADVRAGQVDLFFPASSLLTTLEAGSSIELNGVSGGFQWHLAIDNAVKPLDNLLVRQAIALALDRNAIALTAFAGAATPSGFFPSQYSWAPKLSDLANVGPNVTKAKALLAQAGYPDGFSTHLMYAPSLAPEVAAFSAVVASQLGAIGIKVTLDAYDPTTWSANYTPGKYGLTWNYYSNSIPNEYLRPRPGLAAPAPPSVQALINQESTATTTEELQADWTKLAIEESNQVYPVVPLVMPKFYVAYVPSLSNCVMAWDNTREFLANVASTQP